MSIVKNYLIELEDKGIVEFNEDQGFYYLVSEGPNAPITFNEIMDHIANEREKEAGSKTDNG